MHNQRKSFIAKFIEMESSGGILLIMSALTAIVLANTPLAAYYNSFLSTPFEVRIGGFEIDKPLLLWINDGLMAVFFFLVGLELKREILEGEFSNKKNIILPGVGAVGGMIVPALIYILFNSHDPAAMKGWAIPSATDIAFALGVLTLLGSRVPTCLKIFLISLAIFDDIGAILIIAIFYMSKISLTALFVVAVCVAVLTVLNRRRVESHTLYIFIGVIMWVATLKSGVHATLAGVLLAMFIPIRSKNNPFNSPLRNMESHLHPVVAYFVLPVFAFANSGLTLTGVGLQDALHSVPVGIALGLFFGKQIGIFGFCWLFIKLKITQLPSGMSWKNLYGVSILGGIGFTMSLFIGSLAFDKTVTGMMFDERLGIILGSVASGLTGYFSLKLSLESEDSEAVVCNTL